MNHNDVVRWVAFGCIALSTAVAHAQGTESIQLSWEKNLPGLGQAMISSDGKMVVCVRQHQVEALSAKSGEQLWSHEVPARNPVAIRRPGTSELFVFIKEANTAHVVSLKDGKFVRKFDYPETVLPTRGDSVLDQAGVLYFVDRKQRRIRRFFEGDKGAETVFGYDAQGSEFRTQRFPKLRILLVTKQSLLLTATGRPARVDLSDKSVKVLDSDVLRPHQMLHQTSAQTVATVSRTKVVEVGADGKVKEIATLRGEGISGGFVDPKNKTVVCATDSAHSKPSLLQVVSFDGKVQQAVEWHASQMRSLQPTASRKRFLTWNTSGMVGIWNRAD